MVTDQKRRLVRQNLSKLREAFADIAIDENESKAVNDTISRLAKYFRITPQDFRAIVRELSKKGVTVPHYDIIIPERPRKPVPEKVRREIVRLRDDEGLTFQAIGDKLDFSRQRAYQIYVKAKA